MEKKNDINMVISYSPKEIRKCESGLFLPKKSLPPNLMTYKQESIRITKGPLSPKMDNFLEKIQTTFDLPSIFAGTGAPKARHIASNLLNHLNKESVPSKIL